jgi:hypothetical protein
MITRSSGGKNSRFARDWTTSEILFNRIVVKLLYLQRKLRTLLPESDLEMFGDSQILKIFSTGAGCRMLYQGYDDGKMGKDWLDERRLQDDEVDLPMVGI